MDSLSKPRAVPWSYILFAAATWTPQELCEFADEDHDRGEVSLEAGWLEALSIHARRVGWGDLVEQSINGWKEVDVGLVQGG